jgi:hypothetical protein
MCLVSLADTRKLQIRGVRRCFHLVFAFFCNALGGRVSLCSQKPVHLPRRDHGPGPALRFLLETSFCLGKGGLATIAALANKGALLCFLTKLPRSITETPAARIGVLARYGGTRLLGKLR